MEAHLEILSGVIRVFGEDKSYGDEYDWCSSVRFIDIKTVELLGITSPPKLSQTKAMLRSLAEFGVEAMVFYRMKNGKKTKHTVSTSLKHIT